MNEIQIVQLDDFRKKRIGVVWLPGLEGFLSDVVKRFEEKYAVRTCYSRSIAEIESVVNWADLVFLEWMNELAIEVSNRLPILAERKVIIRCHSYEVLSNFGPQIKWSVINTIIFVADHIKNILLQQIPKLPEVVDIHVVHNGVVV